MPKSSINENVNSRDEAVAGASDVDADGMTRLAEAED